MIFWKLLLDVFPFIWECLFGKKLPKEDGKEESGKDDKENKATTAVKGLLAKIQSSPRLALGLILLLAGSLFLNYHFAERIIVLSREETREHKDRPNEVPTLPVPREAYYEKLVEHLHSTYHSGE